MKRERSDDDSITTDEDDTDYTLCGDIWASIFAWLLSFVDVDDPDDYTSLSDLLWFRTVSIRFEYIITHRVLTTTQRFTDVVTDKIRDFSHYKGLKYINFISIPDERQLDSLYDLQNLRTLKFPVSSFGGHVVIGKCYDTLEHQTDILSRYGRLTQLTNIRLPSGLFMHDPMENLTNLTAIEIQNPIFLSLAIIPNIFKLEKLRIYTDPTHAYPVSFVFEPFDNLRKLDLAWDMHLSLPDYNGIGLHTQLTSLSIRNFGAQHIVIDNMLEHLTNLVSLRLSMIRIERNTIKNMLYLTRLVCESVENVCNCKSITNLTRLTELKYDYSYEPFTGLSPISLERLKLRCMHLINQISLLTNLTILDVKLVDVDVKKLVGLPKLKLIILSDSRLDNKHKLCEIGTLEEIRYSAEIPRDIYNEIPEHIKQVYDRKKYLKYVKYSGDYNYT